MLNWLRTLTESDKKRLRRLERMTDDLLADVNLLNERIVRAEARQRARARRQLEAADAAEVPPPDGSADGVGFPRLSPEADAGPEQLTDADRTTTREQLRANYRQKFGGGK